jgi:hypothetical protein
MNIVGTWDVAIESPFGTQTVTLDFASEQAGVARYPGGQVDLARIKVNGDSVSCDVSVTTPMSVTLKCVITIDGDELTGTAAAGFFGKFPLTGHRTSSASP